MKNRLDQWTYTDFQAFLLLYAASADLAIKPEELEGLIEKTGYTAYKEILPVFQAQSDYDRLQTILNFKPVFYSTPEEVEKLIAQLLAMYQLDHHFSQAEQGILLLLKKILY